jgi:hypothetical protein
VQEKALAAIPSLLDGEVLDVGHVREVLFVRIARLYVQTRVLNGRFITPFLPLMFPHLEREADFPCPSVMVLVKIKTLLAFKSLVKVLDKVSLFRLSIRAASQS